jgi:hypothetical protein
MVRKNILRILTNLGPALILALKIMTMIGVHKNEKCTVMYLQVT